MEDHSVSAVLVLVLRFFLGGFLLSSALGKLRDRRVFAQGVRAYQILPEWAVGLAGYGLPWGELMLALALLLGVALPLAGAAVALLLLVFIGAVVVNLRRGRAIACNCHGIAGTKTIGWGTVARNALLASAALMVALLAPWISTPNGLLSHWPALLAPGAFAVLGLLLAWCFVVVALVEWSVDSVVRITSLRESMR